MQQIPLLLEGGKQLPQPRHIRQLLILQQAGLAGHPQGLPFLFVLRQRAFGRLDEAAHALIEVGVQLLHAADQPGTGLPQRQPLQFLVEKAAQLLQLLGGKGAGQLDEAVFRLLIVEHQHHQHAPLAQRHQRHAADPLLGAVRQAHDAHHATELGEQTRCPINGGIRLACLRQRLGEPLHLLLLQRGDGEKAVHIEAQSPGGGHAAG